MVQLTKQKLFGLIGILIIGCVAISWYWKHQAADTRPVRSLAVNSAKVHIQPMPIQLQASGVVESQHSVNITPQTTGTIKAINFIPGQDVHAGQLLFELDNASQRASLQQMQAQSQRDRAQFAFAQADAKRYAALVKLDYVTKQQYEQTQAAARAAAATLAADDAQVRQAMVQVEHTKIYAPISGKIGNLNSKVGDLATAASAQPLATINQLDALWVNFTIPQQQLPYVLGYQKAGPLDIEIFDENQKNKLGTGKLFFIDNTVNRQTGTVLLKASLDNQQHILWPGLMVTVKLILAMQPQAITIPLSALQLNQKGPYVYLVQNGKAVMHAIKVNRQVNNSVVVEQGLQGTEEVITTVSPELNDGSRIHVVPEIKSVG